MPTSVVQVAGSGQHHIPIGQGMQLCVAMSNVSPMLQTCGYMDPTGQFQFRKTPSQSVGALIPLVLQ
jgi:hypothetical protein